MLKLEKAIPEWCKTCVKSAISRVRYAVRTTKRNDSLHNLARYLLDILSWHFRIENVYRRYMYLNVIYFLIFVTSLLVSIELLLPMFHLTFFSAVINSVTSVAWSEFVFWWIVWLVAGCTFKRLWNERGCCSSFFFVKDLETFDGTLVSLLCWFHEPLASCFNGFLNTLTVAIENTQTVLRRVMSLSCCCLVIFCCSLVTLIHTLTVFVHDTQFVLSSGLSLICG